MENDQTPPQVATSSQAQQAQDHIRQLNDIKERMADIQKRVRAWQDSDPLAEKPTASRYFGTLSIGAAGAFAGVCVVLITAYIGLDPKHLDSDLRAGLNSLCIALPILLLSLFFSTWRKPWPPSGLFAFLALAVGGTLLEAGVGSILHHIDADAAHSFQVAFSVCLFLVIATGVLMARAVSKRSDTLDQIYRDLKRLEQDKEAPSGNSGQNPPTSPVEHIEH